MNSVQMRDVQLEAYQHLFRKDEEHSTYQRALFLDRNLV